MKQVKEGILRKAEHSSSSSLLKSRDLIYEIIASSGSYNTMNLHQVRHCIYFRHMMRMNIPAKEFVTVNILLLCVLVPTLTIKLLHHIFE
jgi:hypothetical protein